MKEWLEKWILFISRSRKKTMKEWLDKCVFLYSRRRKKTMTWKDWLKYWKMTSLKINIKFLQLELKPQEADKNAAWELYVEMLTRIATQYLEPERGDEDTALKSVSSLFGLTRDIIKKHGRDCTEFTKIAVIVLNQIIRPFTAKWHKESISGAFKDAEKCVLFRKELGDIQVELRKYTKMLADMAEVEDLSDIEIEDIDKKDKD